MTAKYDSGWNKSSVLIQVIFMFIAFSICSFYSVDDLVFFLDHELILCNTFFLVLCYNVTIKNLTTFDMQTKAN